MSPLLISSALHCALDLRASLAASNEALAQAVDQLTRPLAQQSRNELVRAVAICREAVGHADASGDHNQLGIAARLALLRTYETLGIESPALQQALMPSFASFVAPSMRQDAQRLLQTLVAHLCRLANYPLQEAAKPSGAPTFTTAHKVRMYRALGEVRDLVRTFQRDTPGSDRTAQNLANNADKQLSRLLERYRYVFYNLPVAAEEDAYFHYAYKSLAQLRPIKLPQPQHDGMPTLLHAAIAQKERGAVDAEGKGEHPASGYFFPRGKSVEKSMLLQDNTTILLTARINDRDGAHGKVHSARWDRPGEQGVRLLVKVQRTADSFRGATRHVCAELGELLTKADHSGAAVQTIEAELGQKDELFRPPNGALRDFGLERSSIGLRAHFVDEFGKYYQVFTAMDGDLEDYHKQMRSLTRELPLGASTVRDARLAAAAQLFVQLEGLHGKDVWGGVAHRDVKKANVVFNSSGAVRLIDFDEASALPTLRDRLLGGRSVYHPRSSMVAPEMYASKLRTFREPVLGKKTDVWSAALTMLDLGFVQDGATDLEWAYGAPKNVKWMPNPAVAFFAYSAWYRTLVPRRSGWMAELPPWQQVRAQVLDYQHRAMARRAYGLSPEEDLSSFAAAAESIHRYFVARATQDPWLTALFLQHALAPKPTRRASAKSLGRLLRNKAVELDDERRQGVNQLASAAAQASPLRVGAL